MSKFYIVDAKTGENRGSVVIDPYDEVPSGAPYPSNYCGECPIWLADAECDENCKGCPSHPPYVVHIPTNTCHKLEPDGKTVVIAGVRITPKIDGKVFWKYSPVYFEKEVVPTNPFHTWED